MNKWSHNYGLLVWSLSLNAVKAHNIMKRLVWTVKQRWKKIYRGPTEISVVIWNCLHIPRNPTTCIAWHNVLVDVCSVCFFRLYFDGGIRLPASFDIHFSAYQVIFLLRKLLYRKAVGCIALDHRSMKSKVYAIISILCTENVFQLLSSEII